MIEFKKELGRENAANYIILCNELNCPGLQEKFPNLNFDVLRQQKNLKILCPFLNGVVMFVDLGHLPYHKIKSKLCKITAENKSMFFDMHLVVSEDYSNESLDAVLSGIGIGLYDIGLYKEKKDPQLFHITVDYKNDFDLQKLNYSVMTQNHVMNLINAPGNKANAPILAEATKSSAKDYGYSCQYYDDSALESMNMEAVRTVGRACKEFTGMLELEYKHPDFKEKPILLVGKGVTFDTGGLSLKGSQNMHFMKCDMGGGAAVLGAVELIAKLGLKTHVVGLVPMAQNSVAGNAVLPGDVITSYSGKTIEIIDTDAEGRLLLADAVSYGNKKYSPQVLIDIATLTGAAVRTFGYECAAFFSDNEELFQQFNGLGKTIGERIWRLPLWEEYGREMNSDIADIKNLSAKPMAGASTAAKFVEFFTDEHPKWAHIDIAGVAFGNNPFSKDKSATGYGVRLLADWIEENYCV